MELQGCPAEEKKKEQEKDLNCKVSRVGKFNFNTRLGETVEGCGLSGVMYAAR